MALTLVATPGASNANSFLTLAEAESYFEGRSPIAEWTSSTDPEKEALLVMATRFITMLFSPSRRLVRGKTPSESYYIIRPTWTGTVATSTQSLPWPRDGMFDRNGNAILNTVVPQDLKEATAEMAGQLAKTDRTLENDAVAQGITSVRAGSVAVSFSEGAVDATKVIPDIVQAMLVPSWVTDEEIEWANRAEFDVVS